MIDNLNCLCKKFNTFNYISFAISLLTVPSEFPSRSFSKREEIEGKKSKRFSIMELCNFLKNGSLFLVHICNGSSKKHKINALMKQNKEKKLLLFNDTSYQCAHIDKNERIEPSAVGIYLRIPPSCSGRQLDN